MAPAEQAFKVVPNGSTPEDGWHVEPGPLARRLLHGMQQSLRALALIGHDLIVDHVLWGPGWVEDAVEALGDLDVLFVRVECPLEIAEQWEWARGDRLPGGARTFYDLVYGQELPYELVLDTAALSPRECAERLLSAVDHPLKHGLGKWMTR